MHLVLISLGSNIRPAENLPKALVRLRELGRLLAISACYESPPAGGGSGPDFWNGAALLETMLDPPALKEGLKRIESDLGRVRPARDLSAPRTIDLDIVGLDGSLHEDIGRYPHVAVPAAEIAPDLLFHGERLADLVPRRFPRHDLRVVDGTGSRRAGSS